MKTIYFSRRVDNNTLLFAEGGQERGPDLLFAEGGRKDIVFHGGWTITLHYSRRVDKNVVLFEINEFQTTCY
jgi:hypothetical protein